jgi:hypothetical protein
MKRKQLRLFSLIATLGMLAFVLSLWMRQSVQSAELNVERTPHQQSFCTGLSSSSYLAGVKARLSGLAASALHVISTVSSHQNAIRFVRLNGISTVAASPPLWLLNCSLLI